MGLWKKCKKMKYYLKKNDEDPLTVSIASPSLTQATTHNIIVLNEKPLETESENLKLKDEIIGLRE